MVKARFHGGLLDDSEKERWLEQAKKDGFDGLWTWLKFLARQRIKNQDNPNRKGKNS